MGFWGLFKFSSYREVCESLKEDDFWNIYKDLWHQSSVTLFFISYSLITWLFHILQELILVGFPVSDSDTASSSKRPQDMKLWITREKKIPILAFPSEGVSLFLITEWEPTLKAGHPFDPSHLTPGSQLFRFPVIFRIMPSRVQPIYFPCQWNPHCGI